jgi:dTDP-4-dehydrorhamnose 3,5-epimerase
MAAINAKGTDLFISHASEDKDAIARPLAEALRDKGWSVWFDEFELSLGDSLSGAIDQGLAAAAFGLVILSPRFFAKQWTRRELDGLTARELAGSDRKVILPVWHEVDKDFVAQFSPPLADRMAIPSTAGLDSIVEKVEYVLETSSSASVEDPANAQGLDPLPLVRHRAEITGPVLISPSVLGDHRGFFSETFRADTWAEVGVEDNFVQDNQSRSSRGTLRGLHFQTPPVQARLVRCARGAIYDVIVDLRRSSLTFGKWEAFELNDDNHLQLFIPPGFAHGFCVISDVADVHYKCTSYYQAELERSVRWNDPDIAIEWPQPASLISERDAKAPLLRDIRDAL